MINYPEIVHDYKYAFARIILTIRIKRNQNFIDKL